MRVGLSESPTITLLEDFILEIFKFKSQKRAKKCHFPGLFYILPRYLNKVLLDDSNIPYIKFDIYILQNDTSK